MDKMKSKIYKIITIVICSGALFLATGELCYAIGEFGIGINLGATYDPNYLEDEITHYNMKVEEYQQNVDHTKSKTITVPYAPVVGINMRYLFNYFILRLGCQYTKPIRQMEGSVTNSDGEEDTIKIKTFQFSFPVTFGLVLPVKDRSYFFIGGGPSIIYSYIKTMRTGSSATDDVNLQVTDSSTDDDLSTNETDKYSKAYGGYHIILGAEVQIFDELSLSTEWIHQEGKSSTKGNDGIDSTGKKTGEPRRVIYGDGDFFLFGISYYIKM